ncbi:MAG: aromatic ring-hydroxylating dioxygenase subunit alpha [Deltaproteobacteria bacterium]|nr:aromatic ring-hydroxylating dioxygenase subunit alpha [Deltaproteobacteria bacterium]MBM4299902.1 aromatic ring-hydroxylating dioxygenase subunit alpha [Deltaproteobacteria bacterium]
MLSHEENKFLCQVGPGTPGGELLRRYWHVVAASGELTAAKPKKRVKILGEDLVLYRDRSGNYGLVAEKCSHRGVSLYYGFVEDDGIRCAYHGWKFDACGKCLDQPFENPEADFKGKIQHPAYPVIRRSGLLFAYMGPPEKKPLPPKWDLLMRDDAKKSVDVCETLRCNWLQAMENSVDPTHTYFLHSHTLKVKGDPDHVPFHYRMVSKVDFDLVVQPTWAGIQKQRIFEDRDAPPETPHPLVFPNILFVPVRIGYAMHFRTPIDDHNTQVFQLRFSPSKDGKPVAQPDDIPIEYVGTTNEAGEFHMDNFTSQDHMAWETQGPLADRSKEHLGEADRGIIMFRKLLREQIEAVQKGQTPVGVNYDAAKDETIRMIPEGSAYDAFSFNAARQQS